MHYRALLAAPTITRPLQPPECNAADPKRPGETRSVGLRAACSVGTFGCSAARRIELGHATAFFGRDGLQFRDDLLSGQPRRGGAV